MNQAAAFSSQKPRAMPAILWGGFACGALDITAALVVYPVIWMRHEPEAGSAKQQESSVEKWEITIAARLINAAECRYRSAKGIYGDYPTLVRSGELQKTGMLQFTVVPKTLQSATDPLPGYLLRLLVSPDGSSYQLSIQEKTPADCAHGLFTDETGIIFDGHNAGCSPR